ncbi:MAG: hypothetical protein AAGU76_06150 [Sedimentibacter sp.]
MTNTIVAADFTFSKQSKFSSSVSKNGIFTLYGRSVSIFKISADCMNP